MLNLVCDFSQRYWSSVLTSFGTIFETHLPQWGAVVLEKLKAETHSATQDITYSLYNMSPHFSKTHFNTLFPYTPNTFLQFSA